MAKQGSYALIPDKLHQPLEQGFIVTKRAADNPTGAGICAFHGGQKRAR